MDINKFIAAKTLQDRLNTIDRILKSPTRFVIIENGEKTEISPREVTGYDNERFKGFLENERKVAQEEFDKL